MRARPVDHRFDTGPVIHLPRHQDVEFVGKRDQSRSLIAEAARGFGVNQAATKAPNIQCTVPDSASPF